MIQVRFFMYTLFIIFIALTRPMASIALGMPSMKSSSTKTEIPKLVLIDRDGVINEDVGAPGVLHPSKLKLTPGAGLALGRLRRSGYKTALITNQSCVGKGLITESDLLTIHRRLQKMLLEEDKDGKFDEIFYCTSTKESGDYRMKPNPGMIEEAMKLLVGDSTENYAASFIGDTLSDLRAAARAGVSTKILVQTGYGCGIMGGREAPDVLGTAEVVNTLERDVEPTKSAEKCDGDPPEESIFPFLYVKNFSSAVEWILRAAVLEEGM